MHIVSITSARFVDAAATTIDCVVTIEELGTIPYSARADDDTAHGQAIWSALQGMVVEPYAPTSVTADDLRAHLSGIAKAAEAAGIEIEGFRVDTDRESQALITGAWALVQQDPGRVIDFLALDGPVQLDAQAMTTVAVAVAEHVQRVFSARAAVMREIGVGAVTTITGVDDAFAAIMEG